MMNRYQVNLYLLFQGRGLGRREGRVYNFLDGGGSQRFDLVLPSFDLIDKSLARGLLFSQTFSLCRIIYIYLLMSNADPASLNHVC